MSLPQSFTASRMSDATFGNLVDDRVGDLERAICDVNGIPFETPIAAPGFLWDGSGLKKVVFQDNGADPAALGELTRRGPYLKFHDGTNVRVNQVLETLTQASIGAVSNTNIENGLYVPGIPANTLGIKNRVEMTLLLRVSLLTGANIAFYCYWGGVFAFAPIISNASVSNAASIPVIFNFGVAANGTTSNQIIFAHAHVLASQTNLNPLGNEQPNIGAFAGGAVDSTTLKTLQLNVLFSAASPSNGIDCLGGKLMVIG